MANLNLNKSILGGRLTADPELKKTPNDVPVCSFTLAVNRKGKDAETDFINCVAWRSTAEFICKYFRKGSSLCIVGNIQTRSWTNTEGQKRFATEVIADEAMFVDSKGESTESAAPTFTPPAQAKFEDVAPDDDLPF